MNLKLLFFLVAYIPINAQVVMYYGYYPRQTVMIDGGYNEAQLKASPRLVIRRDSNITQFIRNQSIQIPGSELTCKWGVEELDEQTGKSCFSFFGPIHGKTGTLNGHYVKINAPFLWQLRFLELPILRAFAYILFFVVSIFLFFTVYKFKTYSLLLEFIPYLYASTIFMYNGSATLSLPVFLGVLLSLLVTYKSTRPVYSFLTRVIILAISMCFHAAVFVDVILTGGLTL